MKRYLKPWLWSSFAAFLFSALFVIQTGTHAESTVSLERKVSKDILKKVAEGRGGDFVRVIVQPANSADLSIDATLVYSGGENIRKFKNFAVRVVTLPVSAAVALAGRNDVSYVSLNRDVIPMGHLSRTTGTDQVRNSGSSGTSLDGTGIGIAILDSGIDTDHHSFLNRSNGVRVIYSEDFTGEDRTDDPYGHGTHVASLAAGNGRISNSEYVGVAPNANLINLRVLNSAGTGTTAYVLRALDWVATNRTTYNIRVVNLSLGMPAVDSYRDDPVCRAVRRLVDAGVVVVAAAGNNGKDAAGNKAYGLIHSPGNEPSALTVGSSNDAGTVAREDDTLASFSSRGPTRSFWTDEAGQRHYDHLMKPDLVAPGNKIVSAEAEANYLVRTNPALDAGTSKFTNQKMMRLSGTSMATPVVAGAAALLLQLNPRLTPNMVKMILMYTSQQLAGSNQLEQGAGEVNVEGAVRLAKLLKALPGGTAVGTPLLSGPAPAPRTTINYVSSSGAPAATSFTWGQGIILNHTYATGFELISAYQAAYGLGVVFGDGVVLGDGAIMGDGAVFSDGVVFADQLMTSSGTIMGDGSPFLGAGVIFGDGVVFSDGVVFGDGVLLSDGCVFGDYVTRGDYAAQAASVLAGGDR